MAITKQERDFQAELISTLKIMFPGCMVMKLDSSYIQGIPDLLILYKGMWATLECKKHANAKCRPNQPYYVERMNKMSFSRFIYPENKEEVLRDLQRSFSSGRGTCIPGSEQVPLDQLRRRASSEELSGFPYNTKRNSPPRLRGPMHRSWPEASEFEEDSEHVCE